MSLAAGVLAAPNLWAQTQKTTSAEILIGQTGALSGLLATANLDVNRGIMAHFDEINAKGGINGKKLKLISLDDAYDVEKAKQNFQELVEKRGVFALLSIGGSPANIALNPMIAEAKIPHIGPVTGLDQLRTPVNPYVFHTRASYGGEMARIAEQLGTIGQKKVVVLHSDNSFGKGATAGFTQLSKARGIEVIAVNLADNPSELDKAVDATLAAQANAVVSFFASTSENGINVVKKLRAKNPTMPLYTISLLGSPSTISLLGESASNMIVSQVVPFPYRLGLANLVKNYQAAMQKTKNTNYSHNSLEGYINAQVLVRGLKGMGTTASRERFIETLEAAPIDLGGYELNFTKGNRNGSRYTDLVIATARGNFIR